MCSVTELRDFNSRLLQAWYLPVDVDRMLIYHDFVKVCSIINSVLTHVATMFRIRNVDMSYRLVYFRNRF